MPINTDACTPEEWDAARRVADAVNLHVLAVNAEGSGRERPGWVAVRLADGRSDGTLYDSRRDAARHQKGDPWCFYVKVGHQTMSEREALIILMYHRMAKENGVVFSEEEITVPQRLEIARPFIPRTLRALMTRQELPRG